MPTRDDIWQLCRSIDIGRPHGPQDIKGWRALKFWQWNKVANMATAI